MGAELRKVAIKDAFANDNRCKHGGGRSRWGREVWGAVGGSCVLLQCHNTNSKLLRTKAAAAEQLPCQTC